MPQEYSGYVNDGFFDSEMYFDDLIYSQGTPINQSRDNVSYSSDFPIVVRGTDYPAHAIVYIDAIQFSGTKLTVGYDIKLQAMEYSGEDSANADIKEVLDDSGLNYTSGYNFEIEGNSQTFKYDVDGKSIKETGDAILDELKSAVDSFIDQNKDTFEEIEIIGRSVIDKSPFVEWGE